MHGAHYIVKVDDDFCPNMEKIMRVIKEEKHPKYAYIAETVWWTAVRIHSTSVSMSIVWSASSFTSGPNKHNCTASHVRTGL